MIGRAYALHAMNQPEGDPNQDNEINGWDGRRVIVVSITRFDATSVLRRLSVDDFAQYTGDIISDSRNEVTIDARSIRPAQRPANFKDP